MKVYFIGAGPGRPDLITVRGLYILRQADVVIYDYLVDERLLDETRPGAQLVCCSALGKKSRLEPGSSSQERINALLVSKALSGKKVVRLKNGDPAIFSRLSEELEALRKHKIRFEVVPGVTAASGASAFAGIPLTDRRFASSCMFVTGHEDPQKENGLIDYKAAAGSATVVFYMACGNLGRIIARLVEVGRNPDSAVAVVQNASLLNQKVVRARLKDIIPKIKKHKVRPPALVIIGEVSRLEREFNWLRQNKRVLFTGLSPERFFGKDIYFHLPLIRICPLEDYSEFDSKIKKIREFDWIILASRYAAEYFFNRLKAVGLDSRALSGVKIASIGNSTANRLSDFGIFADLIPQDESSKGLLSAFRKIGLKGKTVFLPRSDIADKGLEKGLINLGAKVISSFAYRNLMPASLPELDLTFFDEVMFTSPSGVRNFLKKYGRLPKGIKARCIGNVTLNEAKRCRLLN